MSRWGGRWGDRWGGRWGSLGDVVIVISDAEMFPIEAVSRLIDHERRPTTYLANDADAVYVDGPATGE